MESQGATEAAALDSSARNQHSCMPWTGPEIKALLALKIIFYNL
jgi:hypothetical protein